MTDYTFTLDELQGMSKYEVAVIVLDLQQELRDVLETAEWLECQLYGRDAVLEMNSAEEEEA